MGHDFRTGGLDIDLQTAWRQCAARRLDRIHRIAGGGRQHQIRGCQRAGPVTAVVVPLDGRANGGFGAVQCAHAAEQIGKALQVPGFLKLRAAHHRRKAHDFRLRIALTCDVLLEPFDQIDVQRGARVDAINAHRLEKLIGKMRERIGRRAVGWHGGIIH